MLARTRRRRCLCFRRTLDAETCGWVHGHALLWASSKRQT